MIHRLDGALSTAPVSAARSIEEQLIVTAFARLRVIPLGVSIGLVWGLGLFVATAFLLVQGALVPGDEPIGTHLNLLGHYFPGYTVTWSGSLLGFLYGMCLGFLLGVVTAAFLNFNHLLYLKVLRRRLRRRAINDGL